MSSNTPLRNADLHVYPETAPKWPSISHRITAIGQSITRIGHGITAIGQPITRT